jgi:hypothetical protein
MPIQKPKTIRRSVALPRDLVSEVLSLSPSELKGNLNRLVVLSLREFAARRRAEAFAQAMEAMAHDPAIHSECAAIALEFTPAERDGVSHD